MKKNKKLIIFVFSILVITLISVIIFIIISKNNNNSNTQAIKEIDSIKEYGYSINENSTEYQKSLFEELKNILNNETVIDEEYAKIICKLFVSDLFTLSNKITSSDIGGIQYVFEDFKEDYSLMVQSGLYSPIKNNVYGNRTQALPEVSNVEILDITKKAFKYNDEIFDNSYYITLNISYIEDLGYPTSYNVVMSKNEKFMQVVKSFT